MENILKINATSQKSDDRLKQWLLFILCILLIPFFMFVVGPVIEKLPYFHPIVVCIEERGIDSNAVYYTGLEEFSTAAVNMENTMDYMPGNP